MIPIDQELSYKYKNFKIFCLSIYNYTYASFWIMTVVLELLISEMF